MELDRGEIRQQGEREATLAAERRLGTLGEGLGEVMKAELGEGGGVEHETKGLIGEERKSRERGLRPVGRACGPGPGERVARAWPGLRPGPSGTRCWRLGGVACGWPGGPAAGRGACGRRGSLRPVGGLRPEALGCRGRDLLPCEAGEGREGGRRGRNFLPREAWGTRRSSPAAGCRPPARTRGTRCTRGGWGGLRLAGGVPAAGGGVCGRWGACGLGPVGCRGRDLLPCEAGEILCGIARVKEPVVYPNGGTNGPGEPSERDYDNGGNFVLRDPNLAARTGSWDSVAETYWGQRTSHRLRQHRHRGGGVCEGRETTRPEGSSATSELLRGRA